MSQPATSKWKMLCQRRCTETTGGGDHKQRSFIFLPDSQNRKATCVDIQIMASAMQDGTGLYQALLCRLGFFRHLLACWGLATIHRTSHLAAFPPPVQMFCSHLPAVGRLFKNGYGSIMSALVPVARRVDVRSNCRRLPLSLIFGP